MPEIVKSYETIPSYELMKHNTINLLMNLTDRLGKLNQMFLLNRRDRMTELGFISDVLTFYQFLRPKILGHIRQKGDKDLQELVNSMDQLILQPKKFTVTMAIMVFSQLNYFCEEYKLTSTAIFRSTEIRGDTYHV